MAGMVLRVPAELNLQELGAGNVGEMLDNAQLTSVQFQLSSITPYVIFSHIIPNLQRGCNISG